MKIFVNYIWNSHAQFACFQIDIIFPFIYTATRIGIPEPSGSALRLQWGLYKQLSFTWQNLQLANENKLAWFPNTETTLELKTIFKEKKILAQNLIK